MTSGAASVCGRPGSAPATENSKPGRTACATSTGPGMAASRSSSPRGASRRPAGSHAGHHRRRQPLRRTPAARESRPSGRLRGARPASGRAVSVRAQRLARPGRGDPARARRPARFRRAAGRHPEAAAYLARHDQARHWASANREVIAARILECLRTEGTRLLDLSHNWVERVDLAGTSGWLHRKGAAPSTQGPVIIRAHAERSPISSGRSIPAQRAATPWPTEPAANGPAPTAVDGSRNASPRRTSPARNSAVR